MELATTLQLTLFTNYTAISDRQLRKSTPCQLVELHLALKRWEHYDIATISPERVFKASILQLWISLLLEA